MDKIIQWTKQLYKENKISNYQILLDSEKNVKVQFDVYYEKYPKVYNHKVVISSYRYYVRTDPMTKEETAEYENIFGGFVSREVASKCNIYLKNVWSIPDFDFVFETLNYLMNPETNIRKTLRERNQVSNHF